MAWAVTLSRRVTVRASARPAAGQAAGGPHRPDGLEAGLVSEHRPSDVRPESRLTHTVPGGRFARLGRGS